MIGQDAQVAIKQINKSKLNEKQKQRLELEKDNLTNLHAHPNIAQLYEIITTQNNFYIVMQLYNGGDLRDLQKQTNYKLEESKVQYIAAQIISGLKYLKDAGIIHRDIKPDNILINYEDGIPILKITDFGLSRMLKQNQMAKTMCGTPLYSAPEIIKGQEYDFKADLWSFGVIIYELLIGCLPYNATSIPSLKRMFNNNTQIP